MLRIKDLLRVFPGDSLVRQLHEAEVKVIVEGGARLVKTAEPRLSRDGSHVELHVALGAVSPTEAETVASLNQDLCETEDERNLAPVSKS